MLWKTKVVSLLVAVILVATVAADANAADETFEHAWNVANGTWVTDSNWNPSGPPTASDDIVVKNGGTATIGSGDVAVSDRAYIGYTGGNGTVTMTGGTFDLNQIRVSKASAAGDNTGGDTTGTFNLSGGTVTVGEVQVGQGGHGASGMNASTGYFNHSGGTVDFTAGGVLSVGTTGTGTYTLSGTGVVNGKTMQVGYGRTYYAEDGHSVGVFTQSAGTTVTADVSLDIGTGWDEIGNGTYNMQGGTLNIKGYGLNLGYAQAGTDGGNEDQVGTFNLSGGTVNMTAHIIMGDNAAGGQYNINFSGGTLTDAAAGANLTVRGNSAVGATFTASGGGTRTVDLAGTLTNNGVVKADGTTLNMKSFTAVANTIDNGIAENNGWYAVNSGKLQLDDVAVATGAQSVNWGEDAADTSIDLVNSVRAQFDSVTTGGNLSVELWANDLAPGTLANTWTTLGLWSIEDGTIVFDTSGTNDASLAFRYDEENIVGNESDLRVWKWDASASKWIIQHYTADATNNIITATGIVDSFDTGDMFAVFSQGWITGDLDHDDDVDFADRQIFDGQFGTHAPEPATMSVLALGGLALLRRRRK